MQDKLRSLCKGYIESLRFQTALYWADKAVTASNGQVEDVYMLGRCMYFCKQYHRAANLMTSRKLDQKYLFCKYLAALCLYQAQLHNEAMSLLEMDLNWKISQNEVALLDQTIGPTDKNIRSALYLLRGKIYEAMDNRNPAAEDFKTALRLDVYCTEAFELLVKHGMLTAEGEIELLDSLPFDEQCRSYEGEAALVKALYGDQVKKYNRPQERSPAPILEPLRNNLSVRVNYAERCLYGCDFRECLSTLQDIMKQDPHHDACLPIYITCLVAMRKSQVLFRLSHLLVDCNPDDSTAWYAVGCYYYVIGKYEESRKYFHKTTSLDRNHGTAWLMRGHAFAAENEHDQAMAAYFKASQLMRGSHLPMLYVGLEHGFMNNIRLANSFFMQAHSLAPDDPFVLHELGTVAYQNDEFTKSEQCFLQALEMIRHSSDNMIDDTWEPLLNNLGHVCRKLKKYDQALEYYQKALLVCPSKASTYASLGYVHSLTGNAAEAVEYFQKALALKRDDTFSTTMLNFVLESFLNEAPPFGGAPNDVPPPKTPIATALSNSVAEFGSHLASTMEISNISMTDVSEDPRRTSLQVDTPSSFFGRRQDDSVMSGIAPLRTPGEAGATPLTFGFGFRAGELAGFGNSRRERREINETNDEDTPVIQRR